MLTMTCWTVSFQDSPEMAKIRGDRTRHDAHVAYVRAHPELAIVSPTTSPIVSPTDGPTVGPIALQPSQDGAGATWTVEASSREAVEKLILKDPYYLPSLRTYSIRT